jgi:hypothetical protein
MILREYPTQQQQPTGLHADLNPLSNAVKHEIMLLTCMSEVQRVKLSLNSCMIRVLSLYDSSPRVSSSAIASSKAYMHTF